MKPVTVGTIVGRRVLFPPGRVRIVLNEEHRRAYLLLYGELFPLTDVPALKDRDFDGRLITMRPSELAALNRRFRALGNLPDSGAPGPFRDQERSCTGTSRKMQFLS